MTQVMNVYMPLFLGYFAYSLASGLALYFLVSNLLGIAQAVVLKRMRSNRSQPAKVVNQKALPKG
jgi:YidC/Oxa1 family membrane protein insertase